MNTALEKKQKKFFGEMLVYKSADNAKFFSALNLPSFMRDWLVMRFSDDEGKIDIEEVSAYIKKTIPNETQWKEFLVDLLRRNKAARFLAKIKIEFDTETCLTFHFRKRKARRSPTGMLSKRMKNICCRQLNLGALSKLFVVKTSKAEKIFFI